jgi:hypothetical protein
MCVLQYPPDRIILYAQRRKPLHVGFSPENQAQLKAQIQALKSCFFAFQSIVFLAYPCLWMAADSALSYSPV